MLPILWFRRKTNMKKTIKIIALAMALVMCTLALVSCSSFGSIKKNFEKNGYTLQENEKEGSFTHEDYKITYTIHTFQKEADADEDKGLLGSIAGALGEALSTAVVWEFASNADLEKAIENNAEIKAILKDSDQSRFVNGNCVLMTINPDAVKIFNGETVEK